MPPVRFMPLVRVLRVPVVPPPPTDVPPPPELKLFSALAMSEAFAYLIGMTSETNSEGIATSICLISSSIRLTFSV